MWRMGESKKYRERGTSKQERDGERRRVTDEKFGERRKSEEMQRRQRERERKKEHVGCGKRQLWFTPWQLDAALRVCTNGRNKKQSRNKDKNKNAVIKRIVLAKGIMEVLKAITLTGIIIIATTVMEITQIQ